MYFPNFKIKYHTLTHSLTHLVGEYTHLPPLSPRRLSPEAVAKVVRRTHRELCLLGYDDFWYVCEQARGAG